MFKVACDLSDLGYCCGVTEIGGLYDSNHPDFDYNTMDSGFFESSEGSLSDAWDKVLTKIQEANKGGQVLQIWFVRHRSNQVYNHQELRALVQNIPNVQHLGEGINPNSGNTIDGYLWRTADE